MLSARIPPEICALVCDEVKTPGELALLCRTSTIFRAQAQRLLYHSINLQTCSMRKVRSWAVVIARNTQLAVLVQALALYLPIDISFDALDAHKVGRVLASCTNLKELRVSGPDRPSGFLHGSNAGWMLNNCFFRLTKFENLYFHDDWIKYFYSKQDQLSVLVTYNSSYFSDRQHLLPALTAVGMTQMSHLPAGKALERIEIGLEADMLPLLQYKSTLTTLNLVRHWHDSQFSIGHAIKAVAESLPDIVHLGLVESEEFLPCSQEQTSTAMLQLFSRLETFTLSMLNVDAFVIDEAPPHDLSDAAGVHDLSYAVLMACPTLASLFTRSAAGLVKHESRTGFGFEEFSMFWNDGSSEW
ncbi:hypothetical protein R3P38DRAFT_2834215 [Favolaschia claudopus]|uniref:F-box domain-containing protein n=1 Tax=Favolaschia claudopus TaxID=2862362 RepID=A0AAW0EDB3_9AGAR